MRKDFEAAAFERLAHCLYIRERAQNYPLRVIHEWASDDLLTEVYGAFEEARVE